MERIARVIFVGIEGTEGVEPLSLSPGTYVLGRSNGNDIVLKRNDISRQHARIEVREDDLVVADLGSANGTRVNGHRLSDPVVVRDGDEVQFGDRKFQCRIERTAGSAPMEAANPVAEETAIWTPSKGTQAPLAPGIAAIADSPVEATVDWVPPKEVLQAPAGPKAAASRPATPPPAPSRARPKAIETTEDVPVVADEAAPVVVPRRRGGAGKLLLRLFLVFTLLLAVGIVAIIVVLQLRSRAGAPTVGPTAPAVPLAPLSSDTVREDLKKMAPSDRLAFERAIYFRDVKSYSTARAALMTLQRKYPQSTTVAYHLQSLIAERDKEIERQFRRAEELFEYLKYREAKEAYKAVVTLADPEDQRRVAAERKIKQIESEGLDEPRRF